MFVTNCPRCGRQAPDFESPSHQDEWCFHHRLNGFGEVVVSDDDYQSSDDEPFQGSLFELYISLNTLVN